ncbi:hypothetical protein WR25_14729 [Diploscapter pachys]|uniref:Uncharacterized protein n=1 Tax=Diploscapter pachys TaxID=2018661 RepID=A0A2A2J9Q1_9BILA|nr:hypothetical protein WR25_14729 [Diploscapter pachys]
MKNYLVPILPKHIWAFEENAPFSSRHKFIIIANFSTRQHVPIGDKSATSVSVSGSNEKVGKTNSCPAQKSTDCSKPFGTGLSQNPPKPQAPTDTGSKAPTFDPNYMTLNSLNNDCFTKK